MSVLPIRSRSAVRLLPLLTFLALTLQLHAQPASTGRSSDEEMILKKTDVPGRSANTELPPVERPIDPARYRLGPNDQLVLVIPLFEGGEYPIIVSLDNTVVLPRGFPLVDVRGMTLARLRQTVDSLFRTRSSSYKNVGLSLVKPRSIYVTVSGDVLFPGRYVLTAADRPTTAIDIANKLPEIMTKEQEAQASAVQRAHRNSRLGGSEAGASVITARWVSLRHNDGTTEQLDLLRYRAFGNEADNPTLREGDEVIVQEASRSLPTVAIVGAVHTPTTLPYSDGDNALMLARLGGGSRVEASAQEAFISRRTVSGLERIQVDLQDSAALAGIKLSPGDQLIVLTREAPVAGASQVGAVSVVGEVMRPSTYPIVPGVTTLSEVINLAGGPSQNAALSGAFITRTVDNRFMATSRTADDPGQILATSRLTLDDTLRLGYDLASQGNRVSADFVEIIGRGNRSKDIPLENGDEIVIPPNPKQVFVRGRVAYPGWVAYVPGMDVDYYVERAGGYTDAATEGRVQVLKYGTGIWHDPGSTTVFPGDEIYVPGERDVPARTPLETAGTILGITSAVVSIAYSIFAFVRDLRRD